jgi:hypothetical protein
VSATLLAQKLQPGHPDSKHALAELRNLQPGRFARAVLLAAGDTAGQALERLPSELHRDALAARMHARRFVQGLAFQGASSSFESLFSAAVPHFHDVHWLDLSGNELGSSIQRGISATTNDSAATADQAKPLSNSSSPAGVDAVDAVCPFSPAFPAATAALDVAPTALVQQPALVTVAAAVATLTCLQSLDLTGNGLQPDAAIPLASCLPELHYLQVQSIVPFARIGGLLSSSRSVAAVPLSGLA